jgi:MOSC domain-containing protein YiiM
VAEALGQEIAQNHGVDLAEHRAPATAELQGATVNTAIFKQSVTGRIPLRTLNLDGDRQADLSVHGGPYKAVYGYPSEHYEYWQQELPETALPPGVFGENFTTAGLREDELHVGDRFRIGSSIAMIRQPRMPCYKLAARVQRDDFITRFLRSGFCFSVEREGEVEEGDSLQLISRNDAGITIADMNLLFVKEKCNRALLQKAIATPGLPGDWREYCLPRLDGLSVTA